MNRLLAVVVVILSASGVMHAQDPGSLAPNPSFELLNDEGWPSGWREGLKSYSLSTESPRTGTYCLKWVNDDKSRYDLCSIPVKLEPGRRYEIEAWVRTKGLQGSGSGATICLEWWDKSGRHLGGAYPPGIKGDNTEWRRIHGISARVHEGAADCNLLCYVRKDMTGTAWFDDVSLKPYQGPLLETFATNLYRGRTLGGPVRARVGINLLDYGYSAGDVTAQLHVADKSGKVLKSLAPQTFEKHGAGFVFDSTDLAAGEYTVTVEAASKDGRLKGQASQQLLRVTKAPTCKSFIDEHGRLIVDGEPFFPLGTYWNTVPGNKSSLTREHLDIYADSAFNCIMPYDSWNVGRPQLDMAHERGISVIYSVKDFFTGKFGLKTARDERAMIADYVNKYKDHPAIIAWYINDELSAEMYDSLRSHQVWMQELDPGRPTWIVLYQVNDIPQYLGTFDVIGTDPYPIPTAPVGKALDYTRRTALGTAGMKPMWMVPQIFNWASYRSRRQGEPFDKFSAPSVDEMRSMAWQCICGGANGLVFYSWMDLWHMDRATGESFASRWPAIKAMAAEIKRFIPVLLSVDEPTVPVDVQAPSCVAYRIHMKDGKTYLATVNSSDDAVSATFTFAASFASCEVQLGRDTVDFAEDRVHVRFGGTEPKVICLTPSK